MNSPSGTCCPFSRRLSTAASMATGPEVRASTVQVMGSPGIKDFSVRSRPVALENRGASPAAGRMLSRRKGTQARTKRGLSVMVASFRTVSYVRWSEIRMLPSFRVKLRGLMSTVSILQMVASGLTLRRASRTACSTRGLQANNPPTTARTQMMSAADRPFAVFDMAVVPWKKGWMAPVEGGAFFKIAGLRLLVQKKSLEDAEPENAVARSPRRVVAGRGKG